MKCFSHCHAVSCARTLEKGKATLYAMTLALAATTAALWLEAAEFPLKGIVLWPDEARDHPELNEVVALEFGTDLVALSSKRQDAGVALPRKVAMYLSRELTNDSHEKIGMLFNRDYSSVIAAVRSLIKQMESDESLKRRVQDIRYLLEA